MFRTTVLQTLARARFAPACKTANRQEWFCCTKRRVYAVFVLCAATAIALSAQTFTALHSFDGTDGDNPGAALVQATNGYLYGTTTAGGGARPYGGTVFKIAPSGTLTTLYSFCSQGTCTDGEEPFGALVQATNGSLYGTTPLGGANDAGTVFKITPGGTLTTLHSFSGGADGGDPVAALVQATNGYLYGTTQVGGAIGAGGTVFRMTPKGALTTLYNFCSQGAYPDCTDGSDPNTLVQATNGDLYGTTQDGGANRYGTVFKITPGGTLTTLYSFCSQSGCTDGSQPHAGLVQATDGNLYGTTYGVGGSGSTVFKITPSGTLTTLYSFSSQGFTGGAYPYAGLVQDTNGKFYGTAYYGGASTNCINCGTVFSLSVGLGPFVETQTTSGKVGAAVKILGSDLTGATSVSFNGTAATFTVVSRYLITTTVPADATTGKVEVVTPSRPLSSNVPFRVLP